MIVGTEVVAARHVFGELVLVVEDAIADLGVLVGQLAVG